MCGFADRRAQSLARHLEQAEPADLAYLHAGTILADGVAQAIFDIALVLRRTHIDVVDNDKAAQVTNTQLARDFVGGFEVCVQGGRFNVATLGRTCRVNVDRNERFRVVDYDAATRREVDRMRIRRFDL